jgi:tetratricopeptide (TPR) repeat protein
MPLVTFPTLAEDWQPYLTTELNAPYFKQLQAFILAENQYRFFTLVEKKETDFTKALTAKNESLQKLNQSLQKVISVGVGKWTIASLYLLGRAQKDFSVFLSQAKAPAGVTQQKLNEMLKPQIQSYQTSAQASFSQCVNEAERSDVLTEYVQGCLTAGVKSISEKSEAQVLWKSPNARVQLKEESDLLAANPKDIPTLWKVAVKFSKAGEYGMSLVTLQKILDLKSDDLDVQAFMAVQYQAQGQEELALEKFQQILLKNPEHPASIHSIYEIYQRMGFKEKAKKLEALHMKLGPVRFPLFSELQKMRRKGF